MHYRSFYNFFYKCLVGNFFYKRSSIIHILILIYFLLPALGLSCSLDKRVCEWTDKVRIVLAGEITATSVVLNDTFFVTNKHVVEDNLTVKILDSSGVFLNAYVIPNQHDSDLVLISLEKNPKISLDQIATPAHFKNLRNVAYGIGRGEVRVFPEGRLIAYPPNNLSQARIHSTLRNLPGISGGALINGDGELVGIIAGGSGQYNEAIPIHVLNEVIKEIKSTEKKFQERGTGIRLCSEMLLDLESYEGIPGVILVDKLKMNCEIANNKTLFDMIGQYFGTIGLFQESNKYLRKSVALDPNSPTSLISFAIALQYQRLYERQVEVLNHLLNFVEEDPLVLRMAIQAAAFSNNKVFAIKALKLIKKNNPYAYPQASDFLMKYFSSL